MGRAQGSMFGSLMYFLAEIKMHMDYVSIPLSGINAWKLGRPHSSHYPPPPRSTFCWSALTKNMFPPLINIIDDRPQDYLGS